jgi:ABC-2 type transport system permease protein
MSAVRQLVLLRVRTFLREPEALFWTFGFPIVLALGLGLAFRDEADVGPTPVGIEVGTIAEEFYDALAAGSEVAPRRVDPDEAEQALRTGSLPLVLGGEDTLLFRYDPARAESREARLRAEIAVQSAGGATRPVAIQHDPERLPGTRYIDWLIPGLVGLNLMSTGMWGIGFGIVHMRQKKQLKRLIATPMRRSEFLLSQILARLAFLFLEIPPILVFAWLVFDVVVVGSLLSLVAIILLGSFTFSGLGLLAASRARSVEAVSGINNFIMLPMFVLSGVFFSSARFPEPMQPVISLLPLTALNDALRGIFNEGVGIFSLWPEVSVLLGWTAASFLLALRIFRWQ